MGKKKVDLPKIETRFEVKNEGDNSPAELYLYGVIRQAYPWDDEEDVVSSKRVVKALQRIKGKDVNVHINSNGGDVFESVAICNLLKQHDGTVHVYVDGMAGSGASVITTAGVKVFMFANSMQMIHKAWTYTWGNADDLRKTAGDLDKIDAAVKASYMSKFVGTEEELKQLIAEETFLTADECLAFGLCTDILEANNEPGPEESPQASIKESLFAKYRQQEEPKEPEEPKTPETPEVTASNRVTIFDAFTKNKGGETNE